MRKTITFLVSGLLLIICTIFFVFHLKRGGRQGDIHYNIILITVDTLRADHLGCYGYPRNTSSTIDSLANQGTVYTHAIAQRGLTGPSLASIMTSLYPVSHTVRRNGMLLPNTKTTLAEILKMRGYTCGAFLAASAYWMPWRGFDCREKAEDEGITSKAIAWLKDNCQKKIFLWAHYFAPHKPYTPPLPYKNMFDPNYKGKMDGSTAQMDEITLKKIALSNNDLNHIISLYDSEIAFVDDQIKQLIQALKKLDMENNTLVVLTADHGEDLYQHNFYFYHSSSIYESSLKIPLIFRLPGIIPAGKKIDKPVESIDIMPTILQILRISSPVTLEGKSLWPLFKNEGIFLKDAYSEWEDKILSIRTGAYKYIYNPTNFHPKDINGATDATYIIEQEELYNIMIDPAETCNILKKESRIARALKRKILNWQEKYSWDIDVSQGNRNDNIRGDILEDLRSLGYIN